MSKINLEALLSAQARPRAKVRLHTAVGMESVADALVERFGDAVEVVPGTVAVGMESQQLDEAADQKVVQELEEALLPKGDETGTPAVYLHDGKRLMDGDPRAVETMMAMAQKSLKDKNGVVAALLPDTTSSAGTLPSQVYAASVESFMRAHGVETILVGQAALEQWIEQMLDVDTAC